MVKWISSWVTLRKLPMTLNVSLVAKPSMFPASAFTFTLELVLTVLTIASVMKPAQFCLPLV